jgi:hypothetical protein
VPNYKSISRKRFVGIFGELGYLLNECRDVKCGLYINGLDITDFNGESFSVLFSVEFGPVGKLDCDNEVSAEMVEGEFEYKFTYDGRLLSQNKRFNDRYDFPPYNHCYAPDWDDFPDPTDEDTHFFKEIKRIIAKCTTVGKNLHKISVRLPSPYYGHYYSPAECELDGSGGYGAEFSGYANGLSLAGYFSETYSYECSVQKSSEVPSECEMVFKVTAPKGSDHQLSLRPGGCL